MKKVSTCKLDTAIIPVYINAVKLRFPLFSKKCLLFIDLNILSFILK